MRDSQNTGMDSYAEEEICNEILQIAPFLEEQGRDDFRCFVKRFGDLLNGYTEYSISPDDQGLGVMVRGIGSSFEENVRDYLKEWGIEESALRVFDDFRRHFSGVPILTKKDFSEKIELDYTFYWQQPAPVDTLLKVLGGYGISREIQDFFMEASLLLRKGAVFAGMEFIPPNVTSFKLFYANPLTNCRSFIAPAIAALMGKMGLSADAVNHFVGFHNFLEPAASGSVFTSLGFTHTPPAGIKLDYEIIPPEYALQMMNVLEYTEEQQERLLKTMEILQMKKITYVGVKFLPGRRPALKFYFDRRFSGKNSENPEVLADILRSSVWKI